MSAISMSPAETLKPQNYPPLRDEKLQKSLLKHQQEMEKLIRNISARIHMSSGEWKHNAWVNIYLCIRVLHELKLEVEKTSPLCKFFHSAFLF